MLELNTQVWLQKRRNRLKAAKSSKSRKSRKENCFSKVDIYMLRVPSLCTSLSAPTVLGTTSVYQYQYAR